MNLREIREAEKDAEAMQDKINLGALNVVVDRFGSNFLL